MQEGDLLDAAMETFTTKGFAPTRMEDIAERAGVSKGTLYLYFASKEAMFEALVRDRLVPNLAAAEEMLAMATAMPAADLLTALLARFAALAQDPARMALPRLVLAEAQRFPDLARFYRREVVERGLGLIGRILERGVAAGEFRPLDPADTARLFMAPVLMTVIWRTTFSPIEEEGERFDPDAFLTRHLDLFLRAIRADRQEPPVGDTP